MRSCLISRFTLTAANNTVRMTHSVGGVQDVTVTAASYYNQENNFLASLKAEIEAAYAGAYTVTIHQNGSTTVDTTKAEGRIKYTIDSGTLTLNLAHANTTLDPRILGYTVADAPVITTGGIWSDDVGRYTWWPQDEAWEDEPEGLRGNILSSRTSGRVIDTISLGEYEVPQLRWNFVHGALMRVDAATSSDRADQVNLSASDLNAPLERFLLDCYTGDNEFRYYYDQANSPNSYKGPYQIFHSGAQEYNPLAQSERLGDDTDYWRAVVAAESVP